MNELISAIRERERERERKREREKERGEGVHLEDIRLFRVRLGLSFDEIFPGALPQTAEIMLIISTTVQKETETSTEAMKNDSKHKNTREIYK